MNRKVVILIVLLALTLVGVTAALAFQRHGGPHQGMHQGMGGPGMGIGPFEGRMLEHVKVRLNLTEDQTQRIRAIVEKQKQTMKAQAPAQQHEALVTTIFSDNPNQSQIQQQLAQLQQQHAQMLQRMVATGLEINQVLTPEQRAELQKMMAEHKQMRGTMRQRMEERRKQRQEPQQQP
jgi:periplasmic protein CpxP/Spy